MWARSNLLEGSSPGKDVCVNGPVFASQATACRDAAVRGLGVSHTGLWQRPEESRAGLWQRSKLLEDSTPSWYSIRALGMELEWRKVFCFPSCPYGLKASKLACGRGKEF